MKKMVIYREKIYEQALELIQETYEMIYFEGFNCQFS